MSEIREKTYRLRNGAQPASYRLQTKSTPSVPLLYFDEDKRRQRGLRFAPNQQSPFIDEQQGEVLPADIFFEKGILFVSREEQALQEFLDKYHPGRGIVYEEVKVANVADDYDREEAETQAILLLASMTEGTKANVCKVIFPGKVFPNDKEVTVMLKRTIRENPKKFMDAAHDPDTGIRAMVTKALERKILVWHRPTGMIRWNIEADDTKGVRAMNHKIVQAGKGEEAVGLMVQWLKKGEGHDDYTRIKAELGE